MASLRSKRKAACSSAIKGNRAICRKKCRSFATDRPSMGLKGTSVAKVDRKAPSSCSGFCDRCGPPTVPVDCKPAVPLPTPISLIRGAEFVLPRPTAARTISASEKSPVSSEHFRRTTTRRLLPSSLWRAKQFDIRSGTSSEAVQFRSYVMAPGSAPDLPRSTHEGSATRACGRAGFASAVIAPGCQPFEEPSSGICPLHRWSLRCRTTSNSPRNMPGTSPAS